MKTLLIENCNDCPFFKAEPLQNIEDSYKAICTHCELTEQKEWQVKIRNQASIPRFCPLPDSSEYPY